MQSSARPLSSLVALAALGSCLFLSQRAFAVGESVAGFPNYDERLMHELANRARVDPQLEMTQCGSACAEAACYTPQPPLHYVPELNHAARDMATFSWDAAFQQILGMSVQQAWNEYQATLP